MDIGVHNHAPNAKKNVGGILHKKPRRSAVIAVKQALPHFNPKTLNPVSTSSRNQRKSLYSRENWK
ncbi:MAG: hypothetical protein H0S79_25950 [Anaerolineaceae bacterium]|nr:hypothetical protein [Anaerolineaceae bacterium]